MSALRTGRLLLRRFTVHDAASLLALDSDPEVVRWADRDMFERSPTLQDEQERHLPRIIAGYDADPPHEWWAAQERPGGSFLGWFFLVPVEQGWELGYRLLRGAWGRGLATEGCREVVRHGFETLGADRIVAWATADNHASGNVLGKLGMTVFETVDWHGFEDHGYELRRPCG